MDVFDLYAKISLDSKGYTKGLETAKSNFDGFKTHLGDTLKTVAKLTGAAVSAGATAVGKVVKDAASQYGEYQQLVGGVDALFKDSSQKIQNYANNAFSNAQISANEYMELVTSFSGAIIKSTSKGQQTDLKELKATQKQQLKDTKEQYKADYAAYKESWDKKVKAAQNAKSANLSVLKDQREQALKEYKAEQNSRLKLLEKTNAEQLKAAENANNASKTTASSLDRAAELSNTAIQDMADQANKYGKTVQEVSQTYTSLARGNFQTLDNLFGGMFAGTKSGLQELLRTAEKYRASQGKTVKYTESSYGDIVSAIHDVNEMLGISGTSAEEAGTTITGSLGSVKASWKDLLTAMGSGKDVDEKLANFTASVKTFGENIKPTIKTALGSAVEVVSELAPEIARELPSLVVELAPDLLKAGADIVSNLASGIYDAIEKSNFNETAGKLTEKVNEMIAGVDTEKSSEKFATVMNKTIDAVFNVTSTFDFKKAAEKLSSWLNNAINKIDWAKLGQTVSDLFVGMWDFIGTALDEIDWENVGEKIGEFISNIKWGDILTSIFKAIGAVLKAMPSLLKGLVESLDFESAAGLAAFIFAPKLGKKLLNAFKTDPDTKKSLGESGEEVSKQVGDKVDGKGVGTTFATKIKAGLEAFVVGWEIGSWLYNTFQEQFDWWGEQLGKVFAKGITEEANKAVERANKAVKETNSVAKKYEKKGYKIDWTNESTIRNSVDKARIAESKKQKSSGWGISLDSGGGGSTVKQTGSSGYDESQYSKSKTKNNQSTDVGVVWNTVNSDIYLDTGKLVGGTQNAYSKASSQQYNYTARGLAT